MGVEFASTGDPKPGEEFFKRLAANHGPEVVACARKLASQNPDWGTFRVFATALNDAQQEQIHELAAQNAEPFYSPSDATIEYEREVSRRSAERFIAHLEKSAKER